VSRELQATGNTLPGAGARSFLCRRPEGWQCDPGRAERDAGEAAFPGALCRPGGRSVRPTAYGRTLVEGSSATLWKARTIVSHPKQPGEAEAGVGTVKKHHAEGAKGPAHAHSRRSERRVAAAPDGLPTAGAADARPHPQRRERRRGREAWRAMRQRADRATDGDATADRI